MQLVIQMPCFNEEKYLPQTVRDIPRSFPGVDQVKLLVIDDGSTDKTSEIAYSLGVNKVVKLKQHQGLARAFAIGLETALEMGADIVVNTDADNQYSGKDIGKLIIPIINGEADMVVGTRPIESIDYFSPFKKKLQRLGSAVVRYISNTNVPDATSGFRAFSRHAAQKIFIYTQFSYTLETLVLAGKKNLKVSFVSINVNGKLRESRLFDSTFHYIKHSLATLLRLYVIYEPLKTFTYMAASFFFIAFVLFGWHFLAGNHSLEKLLGALFFSFTGIITFTIGILADINSANKKVMEEALTRIKNLEPKLSDSCISMVVRPGGLSAPNSRPRGSRQAAKGEVFSKPQQWSFDLEAFRPRATRHELVDMSQGRGALDRPRSPWDGNIIPKVGNE